MADPPSKVIAGWLERQLAADAMQWLESRREELRERFTERALHITLGMIPRRLGKDDLALDDADLVAAAAARPGWDPTGWSVADAARVLVLLETAGSGDRPFQERFVDLCSTSDVGEAIALYRGLPLYPDPASLEPQAAEGLRTNMRAVFEAVAHRNPYPREQFSEERWNHMVLKALFVDSALHPIQGLDERANPELARMLCDYAHERWAARRAISPELWRCIGPFAEGAMVEDLTRALGGDRAVERKAAALALAASPSPDAARVLESASDLGDAIERGTLDWNALVADLEDDAA